MKTFGKTKFVFALLLVCLFVGAATFAACEPTDNGVAYTITLNYNYQGAAPTTVEVNEDGSFDLGKDPVRNGYEFGGWFTDSDCTALFQETTLSKDVTLYAKWIPLADLVTVTYDYAYEGKTREVRLEKGSAHTVEAPEPRSGYRFEGYLDINGEAYQAGDSLTVNESITLVAQWKRVYVISYDADGGKVEFQTEQLLDRGTQFTVEQAPVDPSRTFYCWVDQNGASYHPGDKLTADRDYYFKATWEGTYKLDIDLDGGNLDEEFTAKSYRTGEQTAVPGEPVRDGFYFDCWVDAASGKEYAPGDVFVMGSQDVTLRARWSKGCLVSFHDNTVERSVTYPSSTVPVGSKVSPIEPTPREDYVFDGWFTDAECTTKFDFDFQSVKGDTDFYAKWSHVYLRFVPATQNGISGWTVNGPSFDEVRYDKGFTATELAHVPQTLTLPKTHEGKPVFGITPDVEAFRYLATVDDNSYLPPSALRKVIIPDTYTEIANEAFFWCKSIEQYEFEGGGDQITRIGEEAFYENDSLVSFTFPSGVKELQSRMLAYCPKLTKLDMSNLQITEIPQVFTYACKSITEIKFPSTLKKIHAKAFFQVAQIRDLDLPEGLEYIGAGAFGNYSGDEVSALTGDLWENYNSAKDENGKYYEDYTGCHSELQAIVIPSTVKFIGDFAFAWHAKASRIEFVNGCPDLTHIGAWAFAFCKNVESVTLPANLQYLGYELTRDEQGTVNGFVQIPGNYYDYDQMQLYGSVFESCEKLKTIVLPQIVDYLPPRMFRNCKALTSVTFQNKNIQFNGSWRAFAGCVSLTTFTVPASVRLIADETFEGCLKLRSVSFEAGSQCETIFNGVFKDCEALTDISLPNGLHDIGGEAFKGCTSLSSLTLPDSLVNIGISSGEILGEVFAGTAITHLRLGKNISTVSPYAFANMHKLQHLEIAHESQMTSFRDFHDQRLNANVSYTFLNDENLEKVTLNDDFGGFSFVTGIGTLFGVGAFDGCVNFKEFVTPSTQKYLIAKDGVLYSHFTDVASSLMVYPVGKKDATYNVLSSVDGKDVAQIYYNAFRGSLYLKKVVIPATVDGVFNGAFREAQSLEEVEFAEGSVLNKIGSLAFYMISTYPNTDGLYDVNVQPTKTPLRSVTLTCDQVPEMTLANANVNGETVQLNSFAYSTENSAFAIYVKDALVDSFKKADGWSQLAQYIKPLSTR